MLIVSKVPAVVTVTALLHKNLTWSLCHVLFSQYKHIISTLKSCFQVTSMKLCLVILSKQFEMDTVRYLISEKQRLYASCLYMYKKYKGVLSMKKNIFISHQLIALPSLHPLLATPYSLIFLLLCTK